MPEHPRHRTWSRRAFLRAGAGGICALCVASVLGCARRAPESDDTPTSEGARKGFMRPVPSPWFTSIGDDRVRCKLCPKACELEPGERAPCRVRENRDGVGYTLTYGNPALIQEDPVERKPFFHVMPGSRALSIATAGCNLACKFCEVWDMALVEPEDVHAYDMPPKDLVAHAVATDVRALSYAFGEPVIFYEYMAEVAELAHEAGLLNLMHTAGYVEPEPLRALTGMLDAANVDLKSFDPGFYHSVVGGELEPVLRTLKLLAAGGVHIEITHIVIPTLNDDLETIGEMCRWVVGELGPDVPLHLSRFYPLYRLAELPRTPVATLERARETALEAGLRYVYLAKVAGHESENTFCPSCGAMVISRLGFVVQEVKLEQGRCAHCGTAIPGRWA